MSQLQELASKVRSCTECTLAKERTCAVPGEGPEDAKLMFIGEAPGYHEDQQGRPFVGAAGQFLEKLLESIGMSREQVFIANMLKCRPPKNRDPLPDELSACSKYIERQIELIAPSVIVTLGRHSMSKFLPGTTIGKAHGRAVQTKNFTLYPIHHPAAALYQGDFRKMIEEDFKMIPSLLEENTTHQKTEAQPYQLPLV